MSCSVVMSIDSLGVTLCDQALAPVKLATHCPDHTEWSGLDLLDDLEAVVIEAMAAIYKERLYTTDWSSEQEVEQVYAACAASAVQITSTHTYLRHRWSRKQGIQEVLTTLRVQLADARAETIHASDVFAKKFRWVLAARTTQEANGITRAIDIVNTHE